MASAAGRRHLRRFIALERQPQDRSRLELTAELDIRLMWPETFARVQ
jgi:hypothetical protein